MTACRSTALSTASWRKPAIRPAPAWVVRARSSKAEFNAGKHVRGTVSMARAANPDSGDSQFFICFEDAPFLDGQYTIWGEVVEGMENVDRIKRGEPVLRPRRHHDDDGRRG